MLQSAQLKMNFVSIWDAPNHSFKPTPLRGAA